MSQDNEIANWMWETGQYDEVRRYDQWSCINKGRKPWSWASLRSKLECFAGVDGCDTCERRNKRVRPWLTSERRPEPRKP